MKRIKSIKTTKEFIQELKNLGYKVEKTDKKGRYKVKNSYIIRFRYNRYIKQIVLYKMYKRYIGYSYETEEYWESCRDWVYIVNQIGYPDTDIKKFSKELFNYNMEILEDRSLV